MKKKVLFCFGLLLSILFLTACRESKMEDEILPEGSYKIFISNNAQNGLEWKIYETDTKNPDQLIVELLREMSYDPDNFESRLAINENVILKDRTLADGVLTLNFDLLYQNQEAITEALMRACIVKTLCQIDDIEYVEFYVNGSPFLDASGNKKDKMQAEDFIDDNEVETMYVLAVYSVYFSNDEGNKLVECTEKKMYDGSATLEQLIIQRLIEGPDELQKKDGLKAVIPSDTILNNVTTKEGVCYVDFSKEFLATMEDIQNEKILIYSVVNSLVELNNINKVQIMIDGKIVESYRDDIELDTIFERDLDIVEGTK